MLCHSNSEGALFISLDNTNQKVFPSLYWDVLLYLVIFDYYSGCYRTTFYGVVKAIYDYYSGYYRTTFYCVLKPVYDYYSGYYRTTFLHFLALSIIIFRDIKMRTWILPANSTKSLVRLHGSAGWPGSVLVAKTNHFWCWQDKG